ncbi:MAG: hypothetical protein IPL70_15635 [Uliginosibacterium sp.]|nr:hypothetical protein [Uliginosibacterium sp.]
MADFYMDYWDAGSTGLHSDVGKAYLGKENGKGGRSVNEFLKGPISDALSQNRSVHEIARLISNDFKELIAEADFDALADTHAKDIKNRKPMGKGALSAQEFGKKKYEHYIRYLQDCIDYQEGEGFRDWSRLADCLLHPTPVVGNSTRSLEAGAPVHQEHVVPLRCINHLVIEGLVEKRSVEDIQAFLENALKIVIIHKDEQRHIDHEMGWKECMPNGWKIGDSVYDRLEKAERKVNVEFRTPTP